METKYISCTDTAKLLREALKEKFPGIKFSVKSKTYSGGASITVRWIDGPLASAVDPVAQEFAGCTFDGMRDLKEYVKSELNGEQVHFGANFVFCTRDLSPAYQADLFRTLAEKFGEEIVGDRYYKYDVREQSGQLYFIHTDRTENGWTLLHRLSVYA